MEVDGNNFVDVKIECAEPETCDAARIGYKDNFDFTDELISCEGASLHLVVAPEDAGACPAQVCAHLHLNSGDTNDAIFVCLNGQRAVE